MIPSTPPINLEASRIFAVPIILVLKAPTGSLTHDLTIELAAQ